MGCAPETQPAPLRCPEGEKNLRPTLHFEKWGHEEVKECKELSGSSTKSWSSFHSHTEQSCNRLALIFRFMAKTV